MGDVQNISLSEQELVRRQKLERLVAEGRDPFVKTKFDVTAHSTDVKNSYIEPAEGGDEACEDLFMLLPVRMKD